jgi:phenylpropionate dioxygenase-like ring-hydroxylating dioxygenase large terminal subunit
LRPLTDVDVYPVARAIKELMMTEPVVDRIGVGTPARLPTERYTSREFALAEARELWGHAWQMACREEEIPNVGDYVEYVIADQSYLVVRSDEDTIKAFANACLHRGNLLATGRGNVPEFRCSFHAWCWGIDGSCREIFEPEDFGYPDLTRMGLPQCKVGRWGGFVFINPDPEAQNFDTWIEPVAADCAPYRLHDMRYMSVLSTVVPANWKIGNEAFIESYHVNGTHPQAIVASNSSQATYEVWGEHGLMVLPIGIPSAHLDLEDESDVIDQMVELMTRLAKMPKSQIKRLRRVASGEEDLNGRPLRDLMIELGRERAIELGYDDPRFTESQYWDQHQWQVFPNLVLGVLPGEVFGFRFRPDGLNPDSSIFEVLSLRFPEPDHVPCVPTEVPYSRDPGERLRTWGPILHQDFSNLEKVQRGMHSTTLTSIQLAGYQEKLIFHHHEVLDSYLDRRET